MFSEYFANANWAQTMPGISSCFFQQKKEEERYPQKLPVRLSSQSVEILFCIRGKITLYRNSGQIEQVENQSIVLLSNCESLSRSVIEEPMEGICLRIDKGAAKSSLSSLCDAYGNIPITMKQIGQIMEQWNGLCLIPMQVWSCSTFQSLLCLPLENRAQYCIMKSFELLYLLYMGRAETSIRPDQWEANHLMQTAKAMQSFLLEHLGEKLTIHDLSRQFHLSATACKSCFRSCCEQPIHQWVSSKRMERAAELLSHTTMSVVEIAQEIGYSGCSQFNSAFKKKFGKTPTQYRKFVCSR